MRPIIKITASVLVLFLFFSCGQNVVFTKYEKIPETGWSSQNKISFDVDITDNQNLNNVFLTIRHDDAYQFKNIFLFLTTQYPDGKSTTDTLECILTNEKGEWIGDGAGDIWDTKIPLKQNVRFPQTGKYKFTFQQGMRQDPLPLVMDFGMVIEKSK